MGKHKRSESQCREKRSGQHKKHAKHHEKSSGETHKKSRRKHRDYSSSTTGKKSGRDSNSSSDFQRLVKNTLPSAPSASSHISANTSNEFNWDENRHVFDKMFFRDCDLIKRRSKSYDEFWKFLHKYVDFQKKKAHISSAKALNFDIKCHKLSFTLLTSDVKELMMRGCLFEDEDESSPVTKEKIEEFRYILHLYIDFCQKQRFNKLRKLREAQTNLPISHYRDDIVSAVNENQVIVVAGDTGCGKSTQVPQYLLASGFDAICCTQPRRIACISLCKRVAYETLNEHGNQVGYQIRFEKSKTQHTKIVFVTEGLLLRQVCTDPVLSSYQVLIIDEVHERHLSCDFLLGVLKCLIHQRKDLKIILMSATINIQLFTSYFYDCPVIQVPGRLFPIKIQYQPIPPMELRTQSGRLNPAPYVRIMNLIDHKYLSTERGDLLIFVSGMTEIMAIAENAREYALQTEKWIILPLHSALSLAEQDKVFDVAPEGVRKCIISTNIAETSVTIDGVRFVVDSGKVKEMSYDPTCRMQRLQEFWISRASAEQRKGRAGRTGPGVCFRMYSEADYEALEPYATPELHRMPLDSLLLQMISMGLPDARKFPFLEPPSLISIEESLQNLISQNALTDEETLTPMGHLLSKLPVDVTIGKILILGSVFRLIEPILSLAAALSVQSPYVSRSYRDVDVMASRKSLESDHGDPFTLLNAYNKWLEMKTDKHFRSRKWCKDKGLEEQRFYEMTKLRQQFKDLLLDAGLMEQSEKTTSSFDRVQRHGELNQLRKLKRKFDQNPRSQKMLRLERSVEIEGDADEEEEDTIDIKDVEFRMRHNHSQVHELYSLSKAYSHRDVELMKLIVCSGLYPQFAIADDHNSYKSDSDQIFHTKSKGFVVLHPVGIFALQPDILQLRDTDDIERRPGFSSQLHLSSKHQLLAYVSLLETTKPYLVNCLRIPTAHFLLLLCHSLDTNQDFTRIVCDGWIELLFPDASEVQSFVTRAFHIRDSWQELLHKIFQANELKDKDESYFTPETRQMQRQLMDELMEFLCIKIVYAMQRLLAADIKNMYVGLHSETTGWESLMTTFTGKDSDYKPHPIKGGLQVKSYFTYGSLVDKDQTHLEFNMKHWQCPNCGEEMVVTLLDQIRHQEKCCVKQKDDQEKAERVSSSSSSSAAKKQSYFCPECQEQLFLSLTEILKHKKAHKQVK